MKNTDPKKEQIRFKWKEQKEKQKKHGTFFYFDGPDPIYIPTKRNNKKRK